MAIEILPAIDLIEGGCVRLSQGDYDKVTRYCSSPLDMAKEFENAGITRLHLVDLDGAKCSEPQNLKVLESIVSGTSLKVEYGGGIKTTAAIESVFNAGGSWAICGSVAVQNRELFSEWISTFGANKVILGADVKGRFVATHGWLKTSDLTIDNLLEDYLHLGLKEMITTDISKDGMLEGPSYELYSYLQKEYPQLDVIVSGGISSMDDIEKLNDMGLKKVIVGKAIYEGRITIEEIKRWSLNE
ncbi:MAG: 1-(5-phosphoribosyl)-5-[(5-phosphoribosylamino)methylideneamino]imidazole-4-carboxamide isomerase [Rikenellaceae bacterium]